MDNYSVALGIFDGVHLGHKRVIDKALAYKEHGLKTAVFTFSIEDIPFKHNSPVFYILDDTTKTDILKSMGVDRIFCPRFEEVHNMSGEDFARDILHNQIHAKAVVCGENFRFGKGASCGVEDLKHYGTQYGFSVEVVEPVLFHGGAISASVIRELIGSRGDVRVAKELLGYEYFIQGKVVHGKQLGRTMGLPTINQTFAERQLIPKRGVYSSRVVIQGTEYPSMTNVGIKPTVSSEGVPIAETHIIGFDGDLYGEIIRVYLKDYIRNEKKFNSIEELKNAIHNDILMCSK
jgi:riboflavin kinase/FMN adenylyltransferase